MHAVLESAAANHCSRCQRFQVNPSQAQAQQWLVDQGVAFSQQKFVQAGYAPIAYLEHSESLDLDEMLREVSRAQHFSAIVEQALAADLPQLLAAWYRFRSIASPSSRGALLAFADELSDARRMIEMSVGNSRLILSDCFTYGSKSRRYSAGSRAWLRPACIWREPMLIDSHCHLNYLEDPDKAVLRAREAGVTGCLCISVDEPGFAGVMDLAASHADIWASAGVHPDAAAGNLDWIEDALAAPEVVAVGETGLDYLHGTEPETQARQRESISIGSLQIHANASALGAFLLPAL